MRTSQDRQSRAPRGVDTIYPGARTRCSSTSKSEVSHTNPNNNFLSISRSWGIWNLGNLESWGTKKSNFQFTGIRNLESWGTKKSNFELGGIRNLADTKKIKFCIQRNSESCRYQKNQLELGVYSEDFVTWNQGIKGTLCNLLCIWQRRLH